LYAELLKRTEGRIIRSDGTGATATKVSTKTSSGSNWESFAKRVRVANKEKDLPELYVDYTL
jgi:hypothetical protein